MTITLTRDGMPSVAADCEAHTLRPVDTVRSTLPEILAWASDNHVTLKKGDKLAQVNARRVAEGLPPFEDTLAIAPAVAAVRLQPIVANEEELLDLVLHHVGTVTGQMTPEIAGWLLKLNQGNRPINPSGVTRFRTIIRSGGWLNTAEPVIVSDAGLLNDGQHRLLAIADTGIAVEMDVRFGASRAAFQATNTGRKRTAGHALHILGKVCSPTQAAIARMVVLHDEGGLGVRGGGSVEIPEVVRAVDANPLISDVAAFIQALKFRPCRASPFGFALLLASRVAPLEMVFRFGTLASTGLALDETEPARALHVRLRDAIANKRRLTAVEVAVLTVRAWNYWIQDRPLKNLRVHPGDTTSAGFPEANGLSEPAPMTPRLDIGAEAVKDTAGEPEKDLAAAILQLALIDLEDPQRLQSGDGMDVLREARLFCFSSDPHWRWSREAWCDLADVDPNYFQRQAAERCKVRW